jgi:hypothetical protein
MCNLSLKAAISHAYMQTARKRKPGLVREEMQTQGGIREREIDQNVGIRKREGAMENEERSDVKRRNNFWCLTTFRSNAHCFNVWDE